MAGCAVLVLSGCGEVRPPSVQEAMEHPFGTQAPFSRGTSKAEVLEAWGNPDQVRARGRDELGNTREEWIYIGRLPNVPVDYEYVSRTKHLFFEGDNLVRWETQPQHETPPHDAK